MKTADQSAEIRALTERAERERYRILPCSEVHPEEITWHVACECADARLDCAEAALSRARELANRCDNDARAFHAAEKEAERKCAGAGERFRTAWACAEAFARDLRAALAAAPDPSPGAGRDEKKNLTSEDRTDGD